MLTATIRQETFHSRLIIRMLIRGRLWVRAGSWRTSLQSNASLIIYSTKLKGVNMKLDFEEWCALNELEIDIELAENGADREMDFDKEKELEKRYDKYLDL